jgi:hypothetical protein
MCHKRKSAPLYNPSKKAEIRQALGRLYREHLTKGNQGLPFIVMDDETYITQNDEAKFSSRTYYAKDPSPTPEDVRTCGHTKFHFKVGLWYAVSDHCVYDYFIWQQGMHFWYIYTCRDPSSSYHVKKARSHKFLGKN